MMPPVRTIDFGDGGEYSAAPSVGFAVDGFNSAPGATLAQDGEWFPGFPDMLSPDDLSAIFHVHKKTAQRMCKRGDLPAVLIGRRWYVPKVRLIEHLKAAL